MDYKDPDKIILIKMKKAQPWTYHKNKRSGRNTISTIIMKFEIHMILLLNGAFGLLFKNYCETYNFKIS